jgi:hypothetical protein
MWKYDKEWIEYLEEWGEPIEGKKCIGCGKSPQYRHYTCPYCGCDDSDEDTFWDWVKQENGIGIDNDEEI